LGVYWGGSGSVRRDGSWAAGSEWGSHDLHLCRGEGGLEVTQGLA
jgi:hypothetical protein